MNYINKFSTFFIILLPFLFFLNGNITSLNIPQLFSVIFVGLMVFFFVIALSFCLSFIVNFKNFDFINYFFSIFVFILFNYSYWNLTKYTYLIILITLPLIISIIVSRSNNLKNIFSISVLTIFLVSSAQAIIGSIKLNMKFSNPSSSQQSIFKELSKKDELKTPNVYFFILDAYGRSDELAKIGINNNYFIENLKNENFFVASKSTSNFMASRYSFDAIYSMDYPNLKNDNHAARIEKIQGDNLVINTFKSFGYRHIRMGPNQAKNQDCSGKEDHCLFQLNEVDGSTDGLGSIYMKLFAMTPIYRVVTIIYENKFKRNVYKKATIANAEQQWKEIWNETKKPFLMEINVWQPHGPYIFDKECNEVKDIIDYHLLGTGKVKLSKEIEHYEGEIHCVNKQMNNFIKSINNTDPNSIIMIMSDHGHPFFTNFDLEPENWSDKSIVSRTANLWAAKFPQNCNERFYPSISAVNTFRFVFSCILDQEIPLLEDKIYVNKSGEYRFILY